MAHERIVCDPKIMVGKPVIKGTRIKVELILRLLSQGNSEALLLDQYPNLTVEDIRAVQAYAADKIAETSTEAAE